MSAFESRPNAPPSDLDWSEVRNIAARFVRHRLREGRADLVDELAQDATVRLFRMSLRSPIRSVEAALNTIADAVVADWVRGRRRWKKYFTPWTDDLESVADLRAFGACDIGDPMERLRFVVIEFFERAHAPCAELARQFFAKVSWKALAEARGRSHAGILQLWSRCVRRLREALAAHGEPLAWWIDD